MNERAIVAAGYDALVTRFAAWSSAVIDPTREELVTEFVERLPSGARVLDLGCGSGTTWLGGLATRFALTGIDISSGQVEAARQNVPTGTFFVGDLAAVEFDDGAFDGVMALYSIGHLPVDEHAAVLARLARWLRAGGLLLASLPAEKDPGSVTDWIGGVKMYFASLGADRYVQILREQGWRVVESRVGMAHEPEGDAAFLWVLAGAPGPTGVTGERGGRPDAAV